MTTISAQERPFPPELQTLNCPSFLVVRGVIYYSHGGFSGVLTLGESVRYKKHGWFMLAFAKNDWGVIEHMQMSTGGTKRPILIPPKKRLYIHRGQWRVIEVDYQSFYSSLVTAVPASKWIGMGD